MNRRVDIREDIRRYQDTLSYALSKIDYSVGESIYMLPTNLNLKKSDWVLLGTIIKFSFWIGNLVWGNMMRLMPA